MSDAPTRRCEEDAAGVGRPAVRALVAMLLWAASRIRFRLTVMGARRYQDAPGTLVVMNHQTDWDGPVLASLILLWSIFRARPGGAARRASFLTRGDLDRPGFIADYLIPNRRWSRILFGRVSLKPIVDALGLRCVPNLGDRAAGPRSERVRRVHEALDRAAAELAGGGCVLLAPEGQFSPDGALAPIRGSVARLGPHAKLVQPVTLTYDHTAGRRPGLFVQFQEPITIRAGGRGLEEEVAVRLRAGRVFALGQIVGILLAAGLDPVQAAAASSGEILAAGVRSTAEALREAGLSVDPGLLRAGTLDIARRWRSWLRRAGSTGDSGSIARGVMGSMDYWRHEAEDGLSVLADDERRRVLVAAAAAAKAVAAAGIPLRPEGRPRTLLGPGRTEWLQRWMRPVGAAAVFAATLLALRLMFRKVPAGEVVATVQEMSLPWLVAASGLNLLGYLARVPVWLAFLEGTPHPASRREVFDLYVGGAFINNFVPLRGGDLARVIYLARQFRLGWEQALSLIATEHVLDLVVIAGYGVVGLILTPSAPAWAGRVVIGFLAAAAAIVGVLIILGRAGARRRLRKGLPMALALPGRALLDGSTQHRVILGTLGANLAGPLTMLGFFRAAGLSAPLGPLLLASAVMTIGVGLPLTFANLGTYELIFAAVYTGFTGWPMDKVVSVAMVSHLVGLATVAVLGGLSFAHLGLEATGPEHRPTAANL